MLAVTSDALPGARARLWKDAAAGLSPFLLPGPRCDVFLTTTPSWGAACGLCAAIFVFHMLVWLVTVVRLVKFFASFSCSSSLPRAWRGVCRLLPRAVVVSIWAGFCCARFFLGGALRSLCPPTSKKKQRSTETAASAATADHFITPIAWHLKQRRFG